MLNPVFLSQSTIPSMFRPKLNKKEHSSNITYFSYYLKINYLRTTLLSHFASAPHWPMKPKCRSTQFRKMTGCSVVVWGLHCKATVPNLRHLVKGPEPQNTARNKKQVGTHPSWEGISQVYTIKSSNKSPLRRQKPTASDTGEKRNTVRTRDARGLEQRFSNGEDFVPQEHLASSGSIF